MKTAVSAEGISADTLYVELSAVLAMMFGEASGGRVGDLMSSAQALVTSELTLLECERAIYRGLSLRKFSEACARDLSRDLAIISTDWNVLRLLPGIVHRARQAFPDEPIRTLDALHVASALEARSLFSQMSLLSLDARVRKVATSLGFSVIPA